ncbi:MAG: GNAT family N-acetyltransferase [Nitrospinota bacterium]
MFHLVRLVLYAFPLPGSVQAPDPSVGVELIRVKKGDPAVEQVVKVLKPDLVHQRLERGEIFFGAVHEGKIVSYCWLAQGKIGIEEINLAVCTQPGEVYLYDAYTLAPWRGKGLYPVVLREMLQYAGQNGFSRALIFVAADNTASRRGVLKAGFLEFQVVTCLAIFGFSFHRYSEALHGQRPPVFKPLRELELERSL